MVWAGELTLVSMRTKIWGVEVSAEDQEVSLKKPNEAGTRQCGRDREQGAPQERL